MKRANMEHSDHRIIPVEHEVFKIKQEHVRYTKEAGEGKLKVVQLSVGFFLEQFLIVSRRKTSSRFHVGLLIKCHDIAPIRI